MISTLDSVRSCFVANTATRWSTRLSTISSISVTYRFGISSVPEVFVKDFIDFEALGSCHKKEASG